MTLPAQVDIALAATEESLYVVPGSVTATVRIIVINRSPGTIKFRVAHVPGGGAAAGANYLAYDRGILANEERMSTVLDLKPNDEIRVQSDTLNVTFQVQGIEI